MSIMIPILSAATLFIIEGVGNILPRNLIPYLYISLLAILVFHVLIKKKPIFFPLLPSIFFSLFLIFSLISTIFFSVDKQISFELSIFYITAFLIFIYFYNNKDLAKKYIKLIVFLGSIIFTFIYLFNLAYGKNPTNEYQLVSSYFNNSSNHLGDFLGLSLMTFFYWLLNNSKKRLSDWLIIFFPFFLLSFSRSAFFALIVVYLVILVKSKIRSLFSLKAIFGLILIASTMIFFFSTVKEAGGGLLVGKINQFLTTGFNLKIREFTAGRITYLKQGLKSFAEDPLFGVGPGNFGYLSKKYQSEKSQWYEFGTTDNAHSLSLDILFENGGLAFIFFGLFTALLLINIFKKNNLENYLLLYLLINFQTDYTYKIYSIFILFMILAAVVYEEKENKKNQLTYFLFLSQGIIIISVLILVSRIFLLLNQPELAVFIYPFNKEAYKQLIYNKAQQQGCEAAKKDADKLYRLSFGYLPTLEFLSSYYESCGDKKRAVTLLDEASFSNKFISFDIVKKDYLLKKEVYGGKIASDYLKKILRSYDHLRYESSFQKQVVDFCLKNGERACQEEQFGGFKYFYEPDPKKIEKVLKQVPYPEDYTINKDTLNERYNYSIEKPKGTFRIVVLGDSSTFGLLVKTKDNWTEKLEDLLNQKIVDRKIKKIEVINLAVHGYDIPYEVERFRRRGIKYNPDLVLWLIDHGNFSQLNEVMFEKLRKIEEEMKRNKEYEKEITKGNYYTSWETAYEETKKEIGETGFFSIIKSYLNSFRQDYSGQIVIIGPSLEDKAEKLLKEALGEEKVYFNPIANFYQPQYRFPEYGQINETGHQMIADEALRFIIGKKLIQL